MTALLAKTSSAAAVLGGVCLLIAGCSGGATPATSNGAGAPHAALAPVASAAARPGFGAVNGAQLTRVPLPGRQSIIYTAALTVRAAGVGAAAAKAAQLATAAGGYVASENATSTRAHPGKATVSMQLKVPVGAYQATLANLTRLGKTLSQSQHAQDVTQTVADVTSRVASAQAAIAQLRALLARAGAVSSLLTVQDQINAQEAGLESLLAQQRALARETVYATISLLIVSTPPAVRHHRGKAAGGFTGGLGAGWRALRQVVSWLLTAAGAVLPFLAPVAVVAYLGYRARRWRPRRRPGPTAP